MIGCQHGIDLLLHLGQQLGARWLACRLIEFGQGHETRTQIDQDGVKPGLLCRVERQFFDQSRAHAGQPAPRRLCLRRRQPGPAGRIAGAAARPGASGGGRTGGNRLDAGNPHPQSRIGHLEHVLALVGDDAHIGCHAGKQTPGTVGESDHGHIGHHVGNGLRRLAHLAHGALEGLAWKRIHREGGVLAGTDAPDIAFVDAGIHLHVRQVLRDDEQFG